MSLNDDRVFDESNMAIKAEQEPDDEMSHELRSQHTIKEEVIEMINKEELASLPHNLALDYSYARAVCFGFWVSIINGAAFLGCLTLLGIVLSFSRRIEWLGYFCLSLPLVFTATSIYEFTAAPLKGEFNPHKLIFGYDIANRVLYLAQAYVLHQRLAVDLELEWIVLPLVVQYLALVAYILYCFRKWVRSGRSLLAIYTIAAAGYGMHISKYGYRRLLSEFSKAAVPFYCVIGIYFLVMFLFVLHIIYDSKDKMKKSLAQDKSIMSREEIEDKVYNQKVEAKGIVLLAILNVICCLGVLLVVVTFHVYSATGFASTMMFKFNMVLQVLLLASFIAVSYWNRNTLTQIFYKAGNFNIFKRRVTFRNKVIHRVSPNYFSKKVQRQEDQTSNKKKLIVQKFLKDITKERDEQGASACYPSIMDDMQLERNKSRDKHRESDIHRAPFSATKQNPKRGSLDFNFLLDHNLKDSKANQQRAPEIQKSLLKKSLHQSKKIIEEVKAKLNNVLSHSKLQVAANQIGEIGDCSVCMEKKMCTLNEPCMHGFYCLKCALEALESSNASFTPIKCPLCREYILKIYLLDEKPLQNGQVNVVREVSTQAYEKIYKQFLQKEHRTSQEGDPQYFQNEDESQSASDSGEPEQTVPEVLPERASSELVEADSLNFEEEMNTSSFNLFRFGVSELSTTPKQPSPANSTRLHPQAVPAQSHLAERDLESSKNIQISIPMFDETATIRSDLTLEESPVNPRTPESQCHRRNRSVDCNLQAKLVGRMPKSLRNRRQMENRNIFFFDYPQFRDQKEYRGKLILQIVH